MPGIRHTTEAVLDEERLRSLVVVALVVIALGGVADLVLDGPERWLSPHVIGEAVLILFSLSLAIVLWRQWRVTSRSLAAARMSLAERRAERDAWRESARRSLAGLSEAIRGQFEAWDLTPAEAEVALRLLKGHSHKRIARETERSERTVRQHAVAVYRKAGLGGRAELAGFFLDDLMLTAQGGD